MSYREPKDLDRRDVIEMNTRVVAAETGALFARLDLAAERTRSDMWREHAKIEQDLRGWLRLCTDDPEGHAEFYAWASHLYFGTPAPGDEDDEAET